MGSVIWIDDRMDEMECVVRGTFPKLWESKIVSKVVFLGNAFRQTNEREARSFFGLMVDVLCMHMKKCKNKEILLRLNEIYNRYEKKEEYEGNNDVILVTDSNENVKRILSKWKEITIECYDEENEIKDIIVQESGEYYVSDLFELENDPERSQSLLIPVSKNNLYMLDVVLLENDFEKLTNKEQCVPVLSIALYHYIVEVLKGKCIVFSSYTFNSILQKNWIDLYKHLYGKIDDNFSIWPRTYFYSGSINSEAISNIKKHIER